MVQGASIVLLAGVCRRRLSSVVVCNTPRLRNVTHQGAARDGGPVLLRLVKATPCLYMRSTASVAVSPVLAVPCRCCDM